MGLISSIVGGIVGSKASKRAANAQLEATRMGIDEMRRQFDIGREDLDPFINSGTDALASLQQGATAGGLDAQLREILNTDTFGGLRDERLQSLESSQGQRGLLRSGQGLEEIANLDTSLALQLQQMLTGQQSSLAANAQNAASRNAANALATGSTIAGLGVAGGNAQANGIIGRANAIQGAVAGLEEAATPLLGKIFGKGG